MQEYTRGEIERDILAGRYGNDIRDLYRRLLIIDRDISTVRQIAEKTSDPRLRNTVESYLETIKDITNLFRTDLLDDLPKREQR